MYWIIFIILFLFVLYIVYLIKQERLSPSLVPVLNLVLFLVAVFFAYKIYDSITAPVRFNKIKRQRYAKVIERLKDIRDAEVAMQSITGHYTASFDSLVRFVDTAKFPIIEQHDSVYKVYNDYKNIWEEKETRVIDTIGFIPVKDSLFKNSDRYKEMMWVPIPGKEKQVKFKLETGKIKKGELIMPLFKASVAKRIILYDQPKDLVKQEEQVVSTKEVNGPEIYVGSLKDVSVNGNWPKLYDIKKTQ